MRNHLYWMKSDKNFGGNRIHKRIKNYRKIKKDNHIKRITEWNFNKTLKWINEIPKSRTRNKDVDNNDARWEITCIEWNQMKTSAVREERENVISQVNADAARKCGNESNERATITKIRKREICGLAVIFNFQFSTIHFF